MKKAGIVTIIDNYNFGNRLQNYAICHYLKKYYGIKTVTLASHKNKRWVNGLFVPELKDRIVLALSHIPGYVEKRFGSRVNRWVNFVNWGRHIPVKHYYGSYDLPEKLGEKYDYLFAGSDQIWNYSFSADRLYSYFLQFAEPNKRAAISASFGVSEIPDEWKPRYREALSEMKYISVRENAGARIIKELTGREVPVLIDPVMMLDRKEWLETAVPPRVDCSVPYVLKYYLGDGNEKKIDLWAEQNGYKIYELMNRNIPELYSAGPGEFLSLIDNASLICSDSFHCIAFAILFKKPFIVYARQGEHNNMTSRMDTLLDKFGFQYRWDTRLHEDDFLQCDFSKVDSRLEAERVKFQEYVSAVIEGKDQFKPHLADKKTCTGCTACANTCTTHSITMQPDKDGFYYPIIDSNSCIQCGVCERVCPILNPGSKNKNLPQAYAAYSLDESVRMSSSSGGIFTEIAKIIIANGGVVYGAAYRNNFEVCHCSAETLEELKDLRGAKYVESRLDDVFLNILARLEKGQMVLFSGTPCQVGGLKAYLKKDYENLLCVDFICHGIPSPVVWKKYILYRAATDNKNKLPVEINLREKNSGWSRYQYSNVFKYADGKEHRDISTQSIYMRLFTDNYISRLSCENCQFKGYSRTSDITLGDFWGIWDIDPEMDDDRGTSAILIQSDKGRCMWDSLGDYVHSKSVLIDQIGQQNHSILYSSKPNAKRAVILEKIRENGITKELVNYAFLLPPRTGIIGKIKRIRSKISSIRL